MTANATPVDVSTILQQLEESPNTLPEGALREAIARKDEITPHLLAVLEHVAREPDEVGERYVLHAFAMFLLAQFREPRAFPLLLKLARLPRKSLDDLLGDIVTEDFAAILASVCGSDLGPIKALVEDPAVDEYVRSAALRALTTVFFDGRISRNELVAYHAHLLHGGLLRTPSFIWSSLAARATAIHPRENLAGLRRAFQEGLIDEFFIGWRQVERVASRAVDEVLAETRNRDGALINDVIAVLGGWSCFRPDPGREPLASDAGLNWRPVPAATPAKPKVGRNDPCPCGSGKKYKKCCWLR